MTDGNEAANTVMVGDVDGTASWVDISTVQDGIGTDNQNIQDLNLSGTILTVGIENGLSQTVDLSTLNNPGTDDQQLQTFTLNGSDLTLTLENSGNISVNLSDLNDTAAITALQTLLETEITDVNSTLNNHIALDADTNISNELITATDFNGTHLTITEAGVTRTLDLSTLNNPGTDDQQLQTFTLNGSDLTLTLENGGSISVNLSNLNDTAAITALQTLLETEITDVNSTLNNHIALDADTNSSNEIQNIISSDGSVTITRTGNDFDLNISLETTTTIANTIAGHKIADYTNEASKTVDINETVTTLTP
ncbi:hypothetical protein C9926_03095, partial [Sulfurovum lithotrophicum]